jgi:uncharacterized protein (DUF1501 family)
MKRRQFLQAGMLAAAGAGVSHVSFGQAGAKGRARFVFVLMRGALDGLAAVPPLGDPAYAGLRRGLALPAPGRPGGALKLDGLFGLHPALPFLHESFEARELLVFHAIASPYRERSHFDGQDVLESGYVQPHTTQTGWLNRALAAVPGRAGTKEAGVALGANTPLVMRGPSEVTTWSPTKLATVDQDTLTRIADLYTGDPLLAARLAEGLAANTLVKADDQQADEAASMSAPAADHPQVDKMGGSIPDSAAPGPKAGRYTEVVRAAARFLSREDGPQVAVFDTNGWDTHANEGGAEGQLAGRLRTLDAGLALLKAELGPRWADTAVLLATEFGRTVAVNGTQGTDHGTATCAFLLGGAVQGGRVVADWPGLSGSALHQGRDLKPTLDLRAVLKGVLHEHLRVPASALAGAVFPGSEQVKPQDGLMRG